jgi:hypothetical protein
MGDVGIKESKQIPNPNIEFLKAVFDTADTTP